MGTLLELRTEWENAPGIWNKEQIMAWRKITDAVHAEGGLMFCQVRFLASFSFRVLTILDVDIALARYASLFTRIYWSGSDFVYFSGTTCPSRCSRTKGVGSGKHSSPSAFVHSLILYHLQTAGVRTLGYRCPGLHP